MFVPTDNTQVQAVKYLLFAGMAALTNIGSRYALSTLFFINYYISISIAYILGLIVNFTLNRNYNFPKSDRTNNQVLGTFLIVGSGGLIMTEGLSHFFLYLLTNNFATNYSSETIETISHIIAVGNVFLYSFFAHKYLTYKGGILSAIK